MAKNNSINAAFSANPPGCAMQSCTNSPVTTGLGKNVDAMAAQSPKLQRNIRQLRGDGWDIVYGAPGKGSETRRKEKKIVIDPNLQGKPALVTQIFAHESGHALYQMGPYVPPAGLTRQKYIEKNLTRHLADEAEATLVSCQVRDEIFANSGKHIDIGVAGAQSAQFKQIYASYPNPADRDRARREIGTLFADGEYASTTSPQQTYRQFYEKPYADAFDAQAHH